MTLMQRRRALMGGNKVTPPTLNPAVGIMENVILSENGEAPYYVELANGGVTDFIYGGSSGKVLYYNPKSNLMTVEGNLGKVLQYPGNAVNQRYTDWWQCRANGTERSFNLSASKTYFRVSVDIRNLADSYCYNVTTGQVYYAGINTPYYGKTNIND